LEIDVEIVIEETGEAKIKDDVFEPFDTNENMFLFDEQDNAKLSGFRHFSSGVHKISDEVASMADKLDVLLICLLQYIFEQLSKNRKEITQYIFNALLNIFEEKILATHRSKFVQYILFFVAGFTSNSDQNFYEPFGQRLLNIFLKPTFAPIKRQSAVLYLASFVSRANYLPLKFVV
jgi:RNA polymerase I-specific transcription initiation factor RRN3